MAGTDYEVEYHNDEWVDWMRSDDAAPEPRLIVRAADTDPMAKIGYLGIPWTTLTMLIVVVGSVLMVIVPPLAIAVLVGGAVFFGVRWLVRWASGYSRGRRG